MITMRTYTKQEAINLFSNRRLNRALREHHIRELRNIMNQNKWDHNRQGVGPIMIDGNGRLGAGQHRIKALIESSLERITLLVLDPASEEDIRNQDRNAPRNLRDRVVMNGGYNSFTLTTLTKNNVATIGRRLLELEGVVGEDAKNDEKITEMIKKYGAVIQQVNDLVSPKGVLKTKTPILATLVFLHERFSRADKENDWLEYIRKVDMGVEITEKSPHHRQVIEIKNQRGRGGNAANAMIEMRKTAACLKKVYNGETIMERLTASKDIFGEW